LLLEVGHGRDCPRLVIGVLVPLLLAGRACLYVGHDPA
jgi:hypothetical protein